MPVFFYKLLSIQLHQLRCTSLSRQNSKSMPPGLLLKMSNMFNRSQAGYLICYHCPKTMIEVYGFNIELIVQTSTYMTASTECHEGYIYRHTGIRSIQNSAGNININLTFGLPCDPRFSDSWKQCVAGLEKLHDYISSEVKKEWGVSNERVTRSLTKKKHEAEKINVKLQIVIDYLERNSISRDIGIVIDSFCR